ncbi:MAG: DUF4332 domain-containing protein [Alphaproteobacteria bacterium]|nr:DUF4332 domain-containing protein [Alphaproteobacteria bacterium]
MAYSVEDIEGIGPAFAKTLGEAGIKTTDDLLEHCGHAKGRETLAGTTGISEKLLLKWANMADLMRISGVAGEYAELLEAAGVDTVKELKMRRPDNLTARMAEVNEAKKLTRRVPAESEVARWIEQAALLEPKITH